MIKGPVRRAAGTGLETGPGRRTTVNPRPAAGDSGDGSMRYEEIGDRLEVIALFRDGRIHPLKFRWRDRVYRVERVNGEWTSDEGQTRFLHYSVMTSGPDVYEIAYNSETHGWRLMRVCLVG